MFISLVNIPDRVLDDDMCRGCVIIILCVCVAVLVQVGGAECGTNGGLRDRTAAGYALDSIYIIHTIG